MRDWRAYVRERLRLSELEGLREERIVEELASQLEDFYLEALSRGASEEKADAWVRSRVPDWKALSLELENAERPNLRPASALRIEDSEIELRKRGKWGFLLADLLQDTRHTIRSIRFAPGFWAITLLILTLGIGATTTIFSVVDGVLLKKLPYEDPEHIVYFQNPSFPTPRFVDWLEHTSTFEILAACFDKTVDYIGGTEPLQLEAGLITPGYFEIFGARSALGRLFHDEDFTGPPTRAVLGYGTWQRLFGNDPDVIGRAINIEDRITEIVGVLNRDFISPKGFEGVEPDIWIAMDPRWERYFQHNTWILEIYGRIDPGKSVEAAQYELNELTRILAEDRPDLHRIPDGDIRFVELAPLQIALVGDTRSTLILLVGAVVMLLLIATANVANIFLARGTERAHEVAVRSAIGAGRGRIVSQLLTESSILALSGGLFGMGLAWFGVKTFEVLNPGNIPLIERISVDWRVLPFTIGVSLMTGLLFGTVPAFRSARLDINSMLREGSRSGDDRDRGRLRDALVVVEIALALILLTGAGLLFNSFIRLQSVDLGFDPEHLIGVELSLEGERYNEDIRKEFARRVLNRLEALPGVGKAALGISVPFQFYGDSRTGWMSTGWATRDGDERDQFTMVHPATSDYFETLGLYLRGRTFRDEDLTADPIPVVVSNSFADVIYPGEDALGRIFRGLGDKTFRITGIVSETHNWGADQGTEATVYLPWERMGADFGMAALIVRTDRDPQLILPALREVIWAEDPNMPLPDIFTLEQRISESLTVPRFYSALLITFAVVAILLAAGGIYGSMLYSVGRRRRELGIRTALGADHGRLVRLVLGRSGLITITGIILGACGAFMLSRFLESMVFGITTTDPLTFIAVATLMGLVAVSASLLPAWKAANTDPVEALRSE